MKVLLVDDHPLFIDGLRNLLASRGYEVVGVAYDGMEALEQARALRPDVVLMDIDMPGVNGLAALRLIKAQLPEVKVVMLTVSAENENLFDAIRNGASGYLLKTQHTDEFLALLRDVGRGEAALSPGLAARILHEFDHQPGQERQPPAELSAREVDVLMLVAGGLTYKEAAAKLFLSEATIKYHMGQILERLHLRNRAEVIEYARRAGLTS